MTTSQLQSFRNLSAAYELVLGQKANCVLIDGSGRVVMFGLTRERAEQYAAHYPSATIQEEK